MYLLDFLSIYPLQRSLVPVTVEAGTKDNALTEGSKQYIILEVILNHPKKL